MAPLGCLVKLRRYKIQGPLSYTVLLLDGPYAKKQIDQIRYSIVTVPDASQDDFLPTPVVDIQTPATSYNCFNSFSSVQLCDVPQG